LFRTWQLGQKDKNNGVLLLVAPNEKRVRIEVGYGLEGVLTDALSSVIISQQITRISRPMISAAHRGRRRRHHYSPDDGYVRLAAKPQVRLDRPQGDQQSLSPALVIGILIAVFIIIMVSPSAAFSCKSCSLSS